MPKLLLATLSLGLLICFLKWEASQPYVLVALALVSLVLYARRMNSE